MMTQTLAIFHDAYRELNSKKLFWIVVLISALVIALFASLGINQDGISFWSWTIPSFINTNIMPRTVFYKEFLFEQWGIRYWLSWLAAILALVSTAGIIPDFISSGSIELSLSRPIGRFRLFITKYIAGLMFVVLQVSMFALGSFLVIGIRASVWEPRLFLAIPLVVALFSYLYSFCAFLGVITRSTIASLLLTLLAWFFFFLVNLADVGVILPQLTEIEIRRDHASQLIKSLEDSLDKPKSDTQPAEKAPADPRASEKPAPGDSSEAVKPATPTDSSADLEAARKAELENQRKLLASTEKELKPWATASRITVGIKTILPKTSETAALLGRTLKTQAELDKQKELERNRPINSPFGGQAQLEIGKRIEHKLKSRTVGWVLGTSLAFEAVMLLIAGWIFCRRDF